MADKPDTEVVEETPELESLDDVLSSQEPEKEPEPDVKPEETPDETPEEEPEDDSPSESDSEEAEDTTVPLAALMDERDKRKKAQAEVEERDARIAELTKEPEQTERPDLFEDPDGALEHHGETLDMKARRREFAMSRDFMMMLKDDYEERETVFMELAREDQSLQVQLWQSDNPARFAYETAVNHEKLEAIQDVDAWRENERDKMRSELRAEVEAEVRAELEAKTGKRDSLTPSLAAKRSTEGIESEPEEDDLDDVLTGVG